jgi:cytochrome c5
MNMTFLTRISLAALLSSSIALAQTNPPPQSKPSPAMKPAAKSASQKAQEDGGKKFDANCSRCHNAPENLNPRITGTVMMHMRVRATLSEQDTKDILRFLAP